MFDFPNPSRYLDNPTGYGKGTYIGPRMEGKERLWRIVFTWLSRTGAAPRYDYDITLPEYQVQHMLAAYAIRAAGKQAVMAMKDQRGVVSDVPYTNYSLKDGRYVVWFEPSSQWIDTGATPSSIRAEVMSRIGTPEYVEMLRTFTEQLDPELIAQVEREAREARGYARSAYESARSAEREAASEARRSEREQQRASAWDERQQREARRRVEREAERVAAEARSFDRSQMRALVAQIRMMLREGFGPRLAHRTEIVQRNQAIIVALPRDPAVLAAMPGMLMTFQNLGSALGFEATQAAPNVVVFARKV